MNLVMSLLEKQLQTHFKKQEERHEKRKDEDYDEDLEEDLLEEDDADTYILSKVSDILHSIFGTHHEEFLPLFEQLLPFFVKLIGPDQVWSDKQWGLCIWDDVIEHCGPHSVKYTQYFLAQMMSFLSDKQPELRQASAYGIGVMAKFGGEVYAATCAEALPLLVKMIQDPESRSIENANPTENAISAIAKICQHNNSQINVNDVLPMWLSWLPVWEDEDEAEPVYNYLCDLIEINHPLILGENHVNLPRIVCIVAEAFTKEAVSSESNVYTRMLNIVRQVEVSQMFTQECSIKSDK
ncbi:Hypothetical predicted protein [Mytilus galloprovincialis]|uniref:Importin-5 n=1 Tax=Mytilus galloprovincialis TaxID=29158 RepID=A0A8B6EBB6_MYTGA|nr:Hypothetical predicted protein [Mytilus galloprovincialis]